MIGAAVVVERQEQTGTNAHRQPIIEWLPEEVEDVLIAPGPRADIADTARPEGVVVLYNLHFPKTFTGSLRGCRIRIGDGDPLAVVGDPQPYMAENTPTRWNRPVEVYRADG